MNTLMYEHPLTEQHLRTVREVIGYNVVGPIGKKLACGDVGEPTSGKFVGDAAYPNRVQGLGAMTEWRDVVQTVVDCFKLTKRATV